MQYALLELQGKKIIMDANEIYSLHHYDSIKEVPYEGTKFILRVVYGLYWKQPDNSLEEALAYIEKSKNYALGYIREDECYLSELCDIQTFEPLRGNIPFAALLNTNINIEITRAEKQALSFFLRFTDLDPGTNVLNRPGIFAVKDQERRIKERIEKENWKRFIDVDRVIRCAYKTF